MSWRSPAEADAGVRMPVELTEMQPLVYANHSVLATLCLRSELDLDGRAACQPAHSRCTSEGIDAYGLPFFLCTVGLPAFVMCPSSGVF